MGPEYVTGQTNSHIENLNMLQSDKAFSKRPQKLFQPFTSVDAASSGSYKSLLKIYESLKNSYLKFFSKLQSNGYFQENCQITSAKRLPSHCQGK